MTPDLLRRTRAHVHAHWRGWRAPRLDLRDEHAPFGFTARHDPSRLLDEADASSNTATHDDRRYRCVCKRSLHDGLASFMADLLAVATPSDVLVEFVETRYADGLPTLSSAVAFDPATVRERGETNTGDSARGVETTWYELDAGTWGVPLGRVAVGGEPVVPPGGLVDGQATFADGGSVLDAEGGSR